MAKEKGQTEEEEELFLTSWIEKFFWLTPREWGLTPEGWVVDSQGAGG